MKLTNSTAECKDGISNYILKISQDCLVHPITHLINKCLEKSDFPRIWEIFKTISEMGIGRVSRARRESGHFGSAGAAGGLFFFWFLHFVQIVQLYILYKLYNHINVISRLLMLCSYLSKKEIQKKSIR